MRAWDFIPSAWSNFTLPTIIQKRLYKFLLRKAIGQFIANELDLENFDIELVNGSVELRDLDLNLQALNECITDTPFTLEQGRVASINASLPWANFWSGDIALKIQGLHLTLKPAKDRKRQSRSKDEEDSPIMSSSLHFADDFLRTEIENQELIDSLQQSFHDTPETAEEAGMDGLQVLTRVIDKMLAKVKVDITDTRIRIIHTSNIPHPATDDLAYTSSNEFFLDLEFPRISYFDETPEFNNNITNTIRPDIMTESSVSMPPTANETIKIITLDSPTIWIRSAQCSLKSMYSIPKQSATTLQTADEHNHPEHVDLDDSQFYEADKGNMTSMYHSTNSVHSSHMSGSTTPRAYSRYGCSQSRSTSNRPYEALLFTTMSKDNWIRMKLRPSMPFSTIQADMPTVKQVDFLCTHVLTAVTPWQVAFLGDLLQEVTGAWSVPQASTAKKASTGDTREAPEINAAFADSAARMPNTMNDTRIQSTGNNEYANTKSSTSHTTHTSTIPPMFKVKMQITVLECYFLYAEPSNLSALSGWADSSSSLREEISHLKLSVDRFIVRLQQFPNKPDQMTKEATHDSGRRDSISFKPSSSSSLSGASSSLLSTLDLRISSLALDEWVKEPIQNYANTRNPKNNVWRQRYDQYNPILEFNDSMRNDYRHDAEFPVYPQAVPPARGSAPTRSDSIRVRIEKKQSQETNSFVSATSFDQDAHIDLQPFALHVDERIVDRLENYVYSALSLSERLKGKKGSSEDLSGSDNSFGQKIYEDLDRASIVHQCRKQTKLRCAFTRIYLYVPDMSQVSVRDEFNDQFHSDLLSVDIKKILLSWSSEHDNEDDEHKSAHTIYSRLQTIKSDEPGLPIKVQVDCNFINVFLKLANDNMARCWFTAKTLSPADSGVDAYYPATSTAQQSPSIEITIRSSASAGSSSVSAAKPGFFGTGSDIPGNLFEHLSRNEGFNVDQKIHVPMEEQAECAMAFKQRTVETSLFVVNCHFPLTRLSITRQVWDRVQILQNDAILWQPRFLNNLTNGADHNVSTASVLSTDSEGYGSSKYYSMSTEQPASINFLRSSSIMSQSLERLGTERQTPSLLALVVVMSDAIWDLIHVPAEDQTQTTYRVHMSDFRYFTVLKHLGLNENITTLDIDDLTLSRITPSHVPIIYRTLPKTLNSKRNNAMISIFARLTPYPELNKQNKLTSVVVNNLCWRFSMDLSFLEQLLPFQKIPEEMVFIDPPTQYNKVYAHILDTSIDYKPLHIPSRCITVVENFRVVTEVISSGQPLLDVQACVDSLNIYLMDDATEIDDKKAKQTIELLGNRQVDSKKYWSTMGFPLILRVQSFDSRIKVKLDDLIEAPGIDIAVLNNVLVFEGCADSFHSLINFLTYTANQGDKLDEAGNRESRKEKGKKPMVPRQPVVVTRRKSGQGDDEQQNEDMLASLDPDAFRRWTNGPVADHGEGFGVSLPEHLSPGTGSTLGYVEEYYTTSSVQMPPTNKPQKPRRRRDLVNDQEGFVKVLAPDTYELDVVEDYYVVNKQKVAPKKHIVDIKRALLTARVRDFDIHLKLYDGHDVQYIHAETSKRPPPPTRPASCSSTGSYSNQHILSDSLSRASSIDTNATWDTMAGLSTPRTVSPAEYDISSRSMSLASEHSDSVFVDSSFGSGDGRKKPSRASTTDRRPQQRRRRRSSPDIEIHVERLSLELDVMPVSDQLGLHLVLAVRDYEVIDNVKTSSWNKFLGYMRPDINELPREQGSDMLRLELTGVRPVREDPTMEYRAKLKLLPLRLYVDQDALNFLVEYFTFDKNLLRSTALANASIPEDAANTANNETKGSGNDIFLQHVEIYPIALKIDYKPKCINYGNIKEGQLAELVNLFHLDGAEIKLSHIKLTGVNGLTRLSEKLAQEWLPHIKNTQVPHMVSGVSPIRSIVNVGSGMADLILLPIHQYRKDGRIIRGLQKGTQSFARATATEALKLSARLASGAQVILEHADDFFSSSSSPGRHVYYYDQEGSDVEEDDGEDDYVYADSATAAAAMNEYYNHRSTRSKFANQPSDISQGLQYAYRSLSRNFGSAAHTILAVPTEVDPQSSGSSPTNTPTKTIIRAVPVAVIKPMIGLTGAFQSILMGLRNTIDPAMRLQNEDKYKRG